MKTILVTGGAGYVGSGLLRVLLEEGYRVVCLDCLRFGGESLLSVWYHPHFVFYPCDLADFETVERILSTERIDAVVHLAAIVGDPACKREPDLAHRTNWNASVHLLKAAQRAGVSRFVFASTCSNYGKMVDSSAYVTEESPLAPVSLYAELKVRFEQHILNAEAAADLFSPTILRFSTVYGLSPRMRFDLTVNEFTKDLAMGKELVIFGEQFWRPYCHVGDFSAAILIVLQAPKEMVAYNVFNVGATAENYTKAMIVEELQKVFPDAAIRYVKKEEDPRDYRVNFDKISRELGFRISHTVPEGVREIKKTVSRGVFQNPEDQKYYNIPR